MNLAQLFQALQQQATESAAQANELIAQVESPFDTPAAAAAIRTLWVAMISQAAAATGETNAAAPAARSRGSRSSD